KWYSRSLTLANSNSSNSSSAWVITAPSLDKIHRSGTDSDPISAGVRLAPSGLAFAPLICAPLIRANRTAFHNLLQKLREPTTHSSLSATSPPGLAPLASVNLVASAPKRVIQSIGSTVFPRDFDIFLPCASRTRPCSDTLLNGTDSSGPASAIA